MLKISPSLISLTLITLSGNANAQYMQMIVDNDNRVLPIFFHDSKQRPLPSPVSNHQAVINPRAFDYPKPIIVPSKITTLHKHNTLKTNPLVGPYFISPARHKVMAAAHASLGIPYLYGGNNPARGLDCSSLMQFIHKKALGVKIPRTAAQQRKRSKTIDYNNLQPGDLLFFRIDRRNNHVGIYIGEGKFIHASTSNRRASIASMNLPYWKKRFVKFGSYLDS